MELYRCANCMGETPSYPCCHCGYNGSGGHTLEYALTPGRILNGKYLVGRVLGRGGFGITYIGFDFSLERKVAIKEYFPAGAASRQGAVSSMLFWMNAGEQAESLRQAGLRSVLDEARKMAKLESISQVVRVLEAFEENNTAYIVMDFVDGRSLKDQLICRGPIPWKTAEQMFLPIIDAMEKIHQEGLVHRDLSPDNLMVLPDGTMKVLDLGAAKDISGGRGGPSMQVVKNGFSPFEQYTERGSAGPWSDVYALAATIFYSLTGKLPPSAMDRMEEDSLDWNMPELQTVPPVVREALRHAMAVQMRDRTRTMAAFAKELRQKAPGPRKKKWILIAAAIALAAVVGIGAAGTLSAGEEAHPTAPGQTAAAPVVAGENTRVLARIKEQKIYSHDGITVTATALKYTNSSVSIWLEAKNTSSKAVTITIPHSSSVNGYACYMNAYIKLGAKSECNDGITVYLPETEACGVDVITDLTFQLKVENSNFEKQDVSDFITLKTDQFGKHTQTYDDSGTKLYDKQGLKILYKEPVETDTALGVRLYCINESRETVQLRLDSLSANGFMYTEYNTAGIPAGMRGFIDVTVPKAKLSENGTTTIGQMQMRFDLQDMEYKDLGTTGVLTVDTGSVGDAASFGGKGQIIYNANGFLVASLGYVEPERENADPAIALYVENNSNQEITLRNRQTWVNGTQIFGSVDNGKICPGQKALCKATAYRYNLKENNITDISELKIILSIDDTSWNTIADLPAVTARVP